MSERFEPLSWMESPIATLAMSMFLDGRWVVSCYVGSTDDPAFAAFIERGTKLKADQALSSAFQ